MNELAHLQVKLQETTAAIAKIERMMADRPGLPSLIANMRSLQKRYETLKADFLQATQRLGVDVCNYRIFPQEDEVSLRGFVNALSTFQSLFSIIYDALLNGPKKTARLSADALDGTSFGFAYTYSGSIGVVLTLSHLQLALPGAETRFEQTLRLLGEMAHAEDPAQVARFSRQLGVAPIRVLYQWATDHVANGLGAAIQWRTLRSTELVVQRPQLERLRQVLASTSEDEVSELVINGELVGADVDSHTFHIKYGGQDFKGTFSNAITRTQVVQLPQWYKATLSKRTRILYSTEREAVSYTLLDLQRLDISGAESSQRDFEPT